MEFGADTPGLENLAASVASRANYTGAYRIADSLLEGNLYVTFLGGSGNSWGPLEVDGDFMVPFGVGSSGSFAVPNWMVGNLTPTTAGSAVFTEEYYPTTGTPQALHDQ